MSSPIVSTGINKGDVRENRIGDRPEYEPDPCLYQESEKIPNDYPPFHDLVGPYPITPSSSPVQSANDSEDTPMASVMDTMEGSLPMIRP